jgi:hypothetical protein
MTLPIVAPRLLKLVGCGIAGDPYAVDGWHLRWFVSPEIGLPRHPFELYVRGSDGLAEWQQSSALNESVQLLSPSEGPTRHTDARFGYALCEAYRLSGAAIGQVADRPNEPGGIELTADPLYVDLRHRRPPVMPLPSASVVELHVRLADANGWARAVAEMNTAEGFQPVDEDAVGSPPAVLTPLVPTPGEMVPLEPGLIRPPTTEFVETPVTSTPLPPSISYPLEVVLRVGGDRIHRIRVEGQGVLLRVAWLDTDEYIQNANWDPMETVEFPDVGLLPPHYHSSLHPNAQDWAVHRLMRGMSKAYPPWEQPVIPPPAGAPQPTQGNYDRWTIVPFHQRLFEYLVGLLERSHDDGVPQRILTDTVSFPLPQGMSQGSATRHEVEIPLLASVLLGAMDYHAARYMGLATVQTATMLGLSGSLDFKLECRYDPRDLEIGGHEKLALEVSRQGEDAATLVSVVPRLTCGPRPLPEPPKQYPPRLAGRASPGSGRAAHVRLSWAPAPQVRAQEMTGVPVMYAVSRRDVGAGTPAESLNPRDQQLDITLPCLPAQVEQEDESVREKFEDVTLPAEGRFEYLVSGCDLWGRWSPWSKRTFTYVDDRVPMSPSNVQAAFIDALDPAFAEDQQALAWAQRARSRNRSKKRGLYALRVSFDWTEDHEARSPQVRSFTVRVRRSRPESDEAWRELAKWEGIEFGPQSRLTPVRIVVKGHTLEVGNVPRADVSLHATESISYVLERDAQGNPTREITGTRYTLDIAGFEMQDPGPDALRQRLYVGVVAHAANASSDVGGPGIALLLYRTPPDPVRLPPLVWSSYPDATGRSNYELVWTAQAGTRYAVYRANENTLLAAADEAIAAAGAPQDVAAIRAAVAKFNQTGARPASQALALRQLASQARLRRAFERLNDTPWPVEPLAKPGSVIYRDELPGYSDLRYVYCVVGLSPTGVTGAWPSKKDYFTAVQVPAYLVPAAPKWDYIREEGGAVEMRFNIRTAQDKDGRPVRETLAAIEIYRCIDLERAGHVRHMRHVGTASCKWEKQWVEFTDRDVRPWRRYYYRAVACAPVGRLPSEATPANREATAEVLTAITWGRPREAVVALPLDAVPETHGFVVEPPSGTGLAARSEATDPMAVVVVDPADPPKATGLQVKPDSGSGTRRILWSSTSPVVTPIGPFRMAVWRKLGDEGAWEQLVAEDAAAFEQQAGFAYHDGDTKADLSGAAAGEIGKVSYRVRVIDPLGRFADSDALAHQL